MPLGEADTRAKLIDPALHTRGWTEDLVRREETAGAIERRTHPAGSIFSRCERLRRALRQTDTGAARFA